MTQRAFTVRFVTGKKSAVTNRATADQSRSTASSAVAEVVAPGSTW